jgi:hypothetical protein
MVDASGSFSDPAQRSEMRGPDPGAEAVSRYLWPRGFKHIAVVTLTQANPDHIAGDSPQQEQLEKLATAQGTQVIHELPASRGTGEFTAAADATGSAAQPAAINNRAPPGIHDFSYIARVKIVRHLRLAPSSQ